MGEDRDAPPASTAEGASASGGKTCERCGTAIETSEWYPVSADRDEDGSIELHHFCSEDCRAAWLEGRSG